MSSAATASHTTVADYFSMAEGPPYYQLVDGELHMSPSPNRYHQDIVRNITVPLAQHVETVGAGKLYFAPSDVVFGKNHVLNPDIYFFSVERTGMLTVQGAEGAPDLVVEVLSPGTEKLDLGRKREIYADNGVQEFWAVSPTAMTVKIFRFQQSKTKPVAVLRKDDTITTPLLPGFALTIDRVFAA
ncbi:MAG TPA: Uma2 family endonuclease [Pirellulales bacterium]|nr:Uma2 family endonuclease [Pirellulales bacterium]